MKKILLLLLITLSSLATISAQSDNRFIGIYGQGSSARLFIFPDGTYSASYYGGIMVGTWEEYDKYLIMKPDTSTSESFYMFALYDEKIKDISIQFDGFEDREAIYSLNNGEKDVTMHPVFNPSPNCITYPSITTFEEGKYTQIQLAPLAGYNHVDVPMDNVSIQALYTFPISAKYNDYKIILNKVSKESYRPFFVTLENNILYFNNYTFYYIGTFEKENEEDLNFAKELAASINQPFESYPFGKNDEDGNWVKIEYPLIPHTRKENKEITFDGNNLFTSKCNDNDIEIEVDSVYQGERAVVGF